MAGERNGTFVSIVTELPQSKIIYKLQNSKTECYHLYVPHYCGMLIQLFHAAHSQHDFSSELMDLIGGATEIPSCNLPWAISFKQRSNLHYGFPEVLLQQKFAQQSSVHLSQLPSVPCQTTAPDQEQPGPENMEEALERQ